MLKNIMSKKNIVIVVVAVVVVLGVGLWTRKMNNNNVYSVVYLTTGEIYAGKLTTFPDLELKNAYILQVKKDATDPTKNTFQLQSISEALWAPRSLHLIKDNIVFYGPLLPTSKIAEAIVAQGK